MDNQASVILIVFFSIVASPLLYIALNNINLTEVYIKGKDAYIVGLFNTLSYDIVVNKLENNPQVDRLILTVNPGSLDDEETFKLGRYLRDKGLNTHLLSKSVVASGAVDLFLSGKKRTVEMRAQLGVHSWSDGFNEASDFPVDDPAHHLNAKYIEDMLGKDDFYWFTINSAPADDMYWMKANDLSKFGVVTEHFSNPVMSIK
ncbi:alpha/beta hydrolase [Veronia nyctiphanis]|uniref:Alpha/beta hydrolase n=1 Tax=Veronia nyctiphanis TaxID=1278244 RepID=A0A4Q0YGR9_9GAMM|nr:alpha/beta hydrolase [Veronia nyctiphanis]RXJ69483.1 alpha/beta hydrolase [Veronia nyctiphanis]